MKTLKSPFIALSLAGMLAMLTACGDQANRQPADEEEGTMTQEMVKRPSGIISLADARRDYELYSKRRVPLIQRYEDSILRGEYRDSTFVVARFVAFDYKEMKQYMQWIEQEAATVGADISSLRIYFSNNPDEEKYVHEKQNSVMLVPAVTPDAETGDQYILYLDNGKPGYLDDDLRPWGAQGMGSIQSEGHRAEASMVPLSASPISLQDGSLFKNEGNSSPPPPNQ